VSRSGTVIKRQTLDPHEGGASLRPRDMKHKTSKALFAYWNAVRGNRVAPHRFEIDPSRISALLPSTFVLERLDAETFRYRLAGTGMCEIFGCELRGTNFLEGWETIDRVPLLRQFSLLTRQGAVAVVYMQINPADEPPLACEVLLLPLLHTQDTVDRVLGAFSPLDHPGWLGDKPAIAKSIIANQIVWPTGDPQPLIQRMPFESPEFRQVRHGPIPPSERPQLRVVEGGLSHSESDKT